MPVTDNFNRANGPLGVGNWTTTTGFTSLDIVSNAIPGGGASDLADYYSGTAFANDQYAQAVLPTIATSPAGSGLGVAVRVASGAQTMYMVAASSQGTELIKVVAGTFTALTSDATAWANGDTIRLEVSGASPNITLRVKRNGSEIGALTVTTETAIASGSAGLWHSSTSTGSPTLDDWEGGDLTAAAQPFVQTDWPVPRGKPFPIELRSFAGSRHPGFVESIPVGGALSGPAPPPRVVPIELRTWVQGRPVYYVDAVVATPFAQTDWPLPPQPRRTPITQRWFASYYIIDETTPFPGSAWPVPAPRAFPVALRTWIHSRPILSDEPAPFFGTTWPVPAPRVFPVALRTWAHSRSPALVDDLPFRNLEWPVPRGKPFPIELRSWVQGPVDRVAALGGTGWGLLLAHDRNHLVQVTR